MLRNMRVGSCILKKKEWKYLLKECHGNELEAGKILYRLNSKKANNILSLYFKGKKEGWIFVPTLKEEFDPRPVLSSVRYFLRWIEFRGW